MLNKIVKLGMEMREKQKRFFALNKEMRQQNFHPGI